MTLKEGYLHDTCILLLVFIFICRTSITRLLLNHYRNQKNKLNFRTVTNMKLNTKSSFFSRLLL